MKGIYTVDKSGRLCLGKEFVGKTFSLSVTKNGDIHLIPGQFIPDQEAWLYRNKEALAAVKRGMAQASRDEGKPLPFDLKNDDAVSTHIPTRSTRKTTTAKRKRPPKQKSVA